MIIVVQDSIPRKQTSLDNHRALNQLPFRMKFKPSVCIVLFLFLIPLIVFIALLPGTVIPNYHGAKFEIAACSISTHYVSTDEVGKDN